MKNEKLYFDVALNLSCFTVSSKQKFIIGYNIKTPDSTFNYVDVAKIYYEGVYNL